MRSPLPLTDARSEGMRRRKRSVGERRKNKEEKKPLDERVLATIIAKIQIEHTTVAMKNGA
jgi:hypothetical protein